MLFVAEILVPICIFRPIGIQFKKPWQKIAAYTQRKVPPMRTCR